MTESVEEQWDEERRFTTEVMRNAKAKGFPPAKAAFPGASG